MTNIITEFSEISNRYQAAFVDLWGCLHNGYRPFEAAVKALEVFRDKGGIVILLTNSPRPKPSVIRQLGKIGVAPDLYHDIAASGDASQFSMFSGDVGQKVFHLGPAYDSGFFNEIPADMPAPLAIERVELKQAQGIVCTGLFNDEEETPEDYRATLLYAKNKGLKLLCTNPDLVVDKGDKRIYCSGALAKAYEDMGGTSLYFGKPYPAIYDLARRRLAQIASVPDEAVICIGDGINTDIRGAVAEGFDSLFITGGLAAADTMQNEQVDPQKLTRFLNTSQLSPTYAMNHLA